MVSGQSKTSISAHFHAKLNTFYLCEYLKLEVRIKNGKQLRQVLSSSEVPSRWPLQNKNKFQLPEPAMAANFESSEDTQTRKKLLVWNGSSALL